MRTLPLILLAAFASPAMGSPTPASPAEIAPERLDAPADANRRLRVQVTIGGQGPYRFVVDTGAERTVISRELAATLGLGAGEQLTITTLAETVQVPSAVVADLRFGRLAMDRIDAPTLPQQSLGAEGLLGIDSLENRNVLFDFRRGQLTVGPSRSAAHQEAVAEGEIVVRARTRYGRLILTDATLDGQRITVVVDTGSEVSVGNEALRAALSRRRRLGDIRQIEVHAVTGAPLQLDYARTSRIRIGATTIEDLPVAFGNSHLFERLNLARRPALLLGMDALRLFDRVAIDFATRRLRLLPPQSQRDAGVRMAAQAGDPARRLLSASASTGGAHRNPW